MFSLTLVSFAPPQAADDDPARRASLPSGERGERRMALLVCAVMAAVAGLAALLVW